MALFGGQVQTAPYQYGDSSQMIQSAQNLAMARAQGVAGMVGQVGDYFKQQGEKKKLIKQSDVQIDAALKLFPELAPSLQSYRDAIKDENVPLDERAMIAASTSDMINNSLNMMKAQTSISIARQREARMGASSGGGSSGGGESAPAQITF